MKNYQSNAIDIAGLGYDSLCSLSALFVAIKQATKEHPPNKPTSNHRAIPS